MRSRLLAEQLVHGRPVEVSGDDPERAKARADHELLRLLRPQRSVGRRVGRAFARRKLVRESFELVEGLK